MKSFNKTIIYNLYWRLYDTYIPERRELDQLTYALKDLKDLRLLMKLRELIGMPKGMKIISH